MGVATITEKQLAQKLAKDSNGTKISFENKNIIFFIGGEADPKNVSSHQLFDDVAARSIITHIAKIAKNEKRDVFLANNHWTGKFKRSEADTEEKTSAHEIDIIDYRTGRYK